MNFNDILEDFARIPQIVEKAKTRTTKQLEIEDAISKFSPDYNEASEIIAAVWAQLRNKYEDGLGVDLEHEFKSLEEALNEADATLERVQDEMTLAKWHGEREL